LDSSNHLNKNILLEYEEPTINTSSGPFFMLNGCNSPYWEKIKKFRMLFHRGESMNFPHIRPYILRSWQRCRAANVPYIGVPTVYLDQNTFIDILKQNEFLVNIAVKIMDELLENILPSKSCIILTDATGVFLHTTGDAEGSGGGACCPSRSLISLETIDGTTSMGICVEEKIPVCVLGSEHYNPHYDGWSCASAPIFNHEGNMTGTLSLIIERDKFHQHTFGLVIAAAKAVTEQMRLRMLLQEVQTVMELLGEAVVVLDANGCLRMMNCYAKRLFAVEGEVEGRDFAGIATDMEEGRQLFLGKRVKDGECSMLLANGTQLHCMFSSSPTPEGGLCITLRESRRVHALANRMTGAKAVYAFSDIQGDSDAMRQALHLARIASENNMTTLILGETGVGKELFAQAIHNGGTRRKQPFIVVNCGAIPRDLVQSELFGYEPGAFTGATGQGAPGKFELADGGTLFLDEIGDMPLAAQINLLRVIQEGEVTRVGGKRPSHVDVRVVAATHHDLALAVEKGTFRRDLYYRLNVLVITVPPLRRRQGDIAALVHFFLHKIAKTLRKPLTGFTPEAMRCLTSYAWPGNVRELENLVERTAVMAERPSIGKEDLPPELWQTAQATPWHKMGSEPEKAIHGQVVPDEGVQEIVKMLRATNGNVRVAAKGMGISRATLYSRILRHGLNLETFRAAL
jgi:transcriptional regulator of acetoin/glycerol metabolism